MNYFNLAADLSLVNPTADEKRNLAISFHSVMSQEEHQHAFFEYCEKWKLAAWIFVQLERRELLALLHPEVLSKFENEHRKIENENEKRNTEARRFLSEFKKNGIDVIVLKGNVFAREIYQDNGYKRMNDFDILIHMEDWDRIQDIYLALGYIPLGFGWSGEKEKPAKFSHVGMSFISGDFSCIIGSQWGLKSPSAGYNVDILEAWDTAQDFDFYGVTVKKLSPEYNLLHLVLHMGIFKCGIRDCMDVYNLVRTQNIDHTKFRNIAVKAGATDKTIFTLKMCGLCSPDVNPLLQNFQAIRSSFIKRRLEKRLKVYERSGDFQNSYNDYFQDIEKVVIYFNLFPAFHKKLPYYLVILKMIFLPKTKYALRLNDAADHASTAVTIASKLKAPYYVFSLIAQEIGWKFTFLLFLKLFIDQVFSIKNYFIRKTSYFDYLKNRGIDPRSIEKAVRNIQ